MPFVFFHTVLKSAAIYITSSFLFLISSFLFLVSLISTPFSRSKNRLFDVRRKWCFTSVILNIIAAYFSFFSTTSTFVLRANPLCLLSHGIKERSDLYNVFFLVSHFLFLVSLQFFQFLKIKTAIIPAAHE
jgi:hypothetical protein